MPTEQLVLDVSEAAPQDDVEALHTPPITLQLAPGDLVLVEIRDPRRAAWFADLCCGLVPLSAGAVKFLGHDWAAVPYDYAAALRGRIGRVFTAGGWIDFLDMATNILLPQLHHTRREEGELREAAARIAFSFGLPGLPTGHQRELSTLDLARAACIRAFLGEPSLVLLESPLQGRFADLVVPILEALAAARQNGAAAIWLTGSDLVWRDRSIPATQRLRLRDYGLIAARQAA